MRVMQMFRSQNLYMKLFLGTLLVTVITLAVSSTILFVFFNRIALKEVYRTDLGSLKMTSKEVLSMTGSAQSLTFQMYRNSTITPLLNYADPNIYDTVAAMREMNNYILSMPYIDSIYVYNPNSENVYVVANVGQNGLYPKEELIDKDLLNLLDRYTEYRPLTPIPRYVWIDEDRTKQKAVFTYLCYDAIGSPNNSVNSAIIVNINGEWINQDIRPSSETSLGNSFIIDNAGNLLSSTDPLEGPVRDEAKVIIEHILKEPSAGYFIGRSDHRKALISFTEPDSMDWRYVRISPYAAVTKHVNAMRHTTILITAAILLFGLLLSWIFSKKLYVPIDRMANRVKMLEVEKRNSLFTIRQNFLRNLILGREAINPRTLRERFAAMGINFDIHGDYRLALFSIDGFRTFVKAKGADLHVYKYATMNIISELAMQAYEAETVDIEEDSILVILGLSAASAEQLDEAYFRSMLLQIQKAVSEHLNIGLSVSYTAVDRQFTHLHSLYKQTAEAIQYRFHSGYGSVLFAPDTIVPRTQEYIYPVDRERRLSEAILAGKVDKAQTLYTELMDEMRRYPIQAVHVLLTHLKVALGHVLTTLQRNHSIVFEHNPEQTWPSPEEIETREQVSDWFCLMLSEVQHKIKDKRKGRQEDMIQQINELIEQQCSNPDLSLNWLAEELDMSPGYIGRLYKQHTMKTIVDVIQTIRLERAMSLLGETHLSIAEIAERTGFTNTSYFYRTFKKHYGITPTDYRRNSGREQTESDFEESAEEL